MYPHPYPSHPPIKLSPPPPSPPHTSQSNYSSTRHHRIEHVSLTTTITHLRTVITHRLAHLHTPSPSNCSTYRGCDIEEQTCVFIRWKGTGSRAEIGTVGRWPPASKSSLPPVGHYGLSVAEN